MISGDPARMVEEMQRAVASFETAGDLRNAAIQRGYIGFGWLTLGMHELAESTLQQVLVAADRLGLETVRCGALHNLGLVLARLGRYEEAVRAEEDALALFRERNDPRGLGVGFAYLAEIHLAFGELEGATLAAKDALAVTTDNKALHSQILGTFARILLLRGEAQRAFVAAAEAKAILDELGALEDGEASIRLVHAESLHAVGRHDEARLALLQALQKLRSIADRLADPTQRAAFLQAVPAHARIHELSMEWGISAA
jgi:tetratricopeptide (TPR) repeat protein